MDSTKGQRLLPAMIDEAAVTTPDRAFASVPRGTEAREGFVDVSYKQLARAIDRCAWWMDEQLGQSVDFATLGYVGATDLRYAIIFVACMKTRRTAFFPSPRNSVDGHVSLLEQAKCQVFLLPEHPPPFLPAVFAQRPTKTLLLPSLASWLDDGEVQAYAMTKTFAEARLDPVVALHTSGTTGIPTLIFIPHGALAVLDAYQLIPALGGPPTTFDMFRRARAFFPFPMFHSAGLLTFTQVSVSYKMVMVMPPPGPLTADLADQVHQHGNVTGSLLPPSVLADLCKTPAHLANLARLDFVAFGGGPLSRHVGAAMTTKTTAYNLIGSTETSSLPTQNLDQEDCEYLSFSPYMGGEFRHHGDDLYELVIVRKPELERFQGIFTVFPHLQAYPMKDLYSKHPTKRDLWLYRGRADDVIVFVNGEKLNPLAMEMLISKHQEVAAALVVGQGQFQSALLVEPRTPRTTEAEKAALVESIWPSVQEANQECPTHGRLAKHLILITAPEKPLPRASKGTIQRKPAVDLFAAEIDTLYAASQQPHDSAGLDMATLPSLTRSLQALVASCMELEAVDSETDLFALGLDSLQVINLTRQINVTAGAPLVEAQTIYAHPSVARLAAAMWLAHTHSTMLTAEHNPLAAMRQLLALYTSDLALDPRRQPLHTVPRPMTILLTGSTGTLGTYLLAALLDTPHVGHIYCLNRTADAPARQHALHTARGLTTAFSPDRLTFLHASLAHDDLGLPHATHAVLLARTTHVLHAAWLVDFAQPLAHFAHAVCGVRQLVRFTRSSAHHAHLLFISSVGAALTHPSPVPEALLPTTTPAPATGYGQAKLVAERLLGEAAAHNGTRVTIARLGQIAGPAVVRSTARAAAWNDAEWFPRLVAGAAHMRLLPADLGPLEEVAWVPVDVLAQVVVEMLEGMGARVEGETNGLEKGEMNGLEEDKTNGLEERKRAGVGKRETTTNQANETMSNGVEETAVNGQSTNGPSTNGPVVYNVLNPRRTTYAALREVVKARLEAAVGKVEVVGFAEWVEAVRAEGHAEGMAEKGAASGGIYMNGKATEKHGDGSVARKPFANGKGTLENGDSSLKKGTGPSGNGDGSLKTAHGSLKNGAGPLENGTAPTRNGTTTTEEHTNGDAGQSTNGYLAAVHTAQHTANGSVERTAPSSDTERGADTVGGAEGPPTREAVRNGHITNGHTITNGTDGTNGHLTTNGHHLPSSNLASPPGHNPALGLLAFWDSCVAEGTRRYPVFETAKAERASETLAAVPVVGREWMEGWMRGWGF